MKDYRGTGLQQKVEEGRLDISLRFRKYISVTVDTTCSVLSHPFLSLDKVW